MHAEAAPNATTFGSTRSPIAVNATAVQTCTMQMSPRLGSLVLKKGVHIGALSEPDRALVLALAANAIEPGRLHREDDVNRLLLDWLADVGAMLHTDHVELRRWLVDGGYVSRDPWGHAYGRGRAELERAHDVLGTSDAEALARAVRSARVAAQSARIANRLAYESHRSG